MTRISVTGAAAALGVSPRRIRQLIRDGRLQADLVGRTYLIDEDSVSVLKQEARPAGRPRMAIHRGSLVWDAAASAILGLEAAEANRFVATLTGAELHRLGLKDAVRRYSLDERVADAGCDLLLEVPADLQHPYIPGGTSVWQVKSGKRAPDAAHEIDAPRHTFIRDRLSQGASYILACTQSFTPEKQERILAAFRDRVHAVRADTDVRLLIASDFAEWSLAHPSIIRRLSPTLSMLSDWQQWDRTIRGDESLPWIGDGQRDEYIARIREWVTDSVGIGPHVHIYGPSGVGKSRLALEAFASPELRDQVVFIDSPDRAASALLDELIESGDELGTIVVDNCDFDQVPRLQALATRTTGKLRLITIGGLAGLSLSHPTPTYWRLGPLQTHSMVDALQRSLGLDGDQAVFVAELTQGFPQLAWLLGRRLREGSIASAAGFSTRADTISMLAALVPTEEARLHLGVVALFTRLGVDEELTVELEAVSRAFELKAHEVRRTVNRYPDLVQHFGRFVQVTPGLICAWLIADLLAVYGSDTVMQWISNLPSELHDRFAAQISVLGEDAAYGPLAARFLQSVDLRQPHAVWISNLRAAASLDHMATGRWLVEAERADPEAFQRALGSMQDMSVFEHLLWFEDSFALALEMLFRTAVRAAPSPSTPGAQSMLGGVFLTFLGGTAVEYERRVVELRRLVDDDDSDGGRGVGARALLAGLSHFQGRSAPSLQGGTVRPSEWRPQTWQQDHEARVLVWNSLMELLDALQDGTRREELWVNVIDGLGQLAQVLDPQVWLSDLERREWPLNLRIKLRHGLSLVSSFGHLPQPIRDRCNALCARLGPPSRPTELAQFLLSGEPYELARSYADEEGEVNRACASLAAAMITESVILEYVLEAASRARVSTVGTIFEELAKAVDKPEPWFERITASDSPVPLAVAGYLHGREGRGDGQWVTERLTRVPAAIPQVMMAVEATEERLQAILEAAASGLVEWTALAGVLLLHRWCALLNDEAFTHVIGQLLLSSPAVYHRAVLSALDDRSERTVIQSESLVELTERALLATADDVDPMMSFYRRRLMQRVRIGYATRLAVTLTLVRHGSQDQSELTALFRPLLAERGVEAVRDVFAAADRERESLSWSPLDHDIRGACLLSLAAAQVGVEPVWQFIEEGGLGGGSVMNHIDMATPEASELVVRVLDAASDRILDAARTAFIHPGGASFGSLSAVYARARDRALHWSATVTSDRVRRWAAELARAIDASLPTYRQREEEFR